MASDRELLEALKSKDIESLLDSTSTARSVVERDLLRRREAIALQLSRATAARDEAAASRTAAQGSVLGQLDTGWHPTRLTIAIVALVFATMTGGLSWFFQWQWGLSWLQSWRAPFSSSWLNLAAWGVAYLAILVTLFEVHFYSWRLPRRRVAVNVQFKIGDLSAAEITAKKRWQEQLLDIVRDHVTEILNSDQGPVYRSILKTRSTKDNQREPITIGVGLSEVAVDDNHVATSVQKQILGLLTNLRGASIGISGPRGVGKSSLLAALCGANPTINGRPAIAINTSAPVEYDGREFLLHLFASLCRQVLRTEGQERLLNEYELALHQERRWRRMTALGASPQIGRVLSVFGMGLLVVSLGLSAVQVMLIQTATTLTVSAPTTPGNPSPSVQGTSSANKQLAQVSPPKPAQEANNATGSISSASGANSTPASSPVSSASVFAALPSTPLFTLAVLAMTFGLFLPFATRTIRRSVSDDMPFRYRIGGDRADIVERALSELHNIGFQRSHTAGWAGNIKAPVGMDLGASAGLTIAQRPESLPELVERFRSFVEQVGIAFNNVVLIGIDELDKLKTAQQAEDFLNGVKSVFGIPGCFYLISVSEHALAAFERRGMGFRDAFDSALDDIVHVDFLNLEQSRTLLNRRILRLPDPFLQVCYMLSGGLPRDLIRIARALLNHADAEREGVIGIRKATVKLLNGDVKARIRATAIAMRGVKELPESSDLQLAVAKLPMLDHVQRATAALEKYQKQLEALSALRTSDEGRTLLRLGEELAAYYESMILIRRVGALSASEFGWTKATERHLADSVADTRQALEASVAVARGRLAKARREVAEVAKIVGMTVHPGPGIQSKQASA